MNCSNCCMLMKKNIHYIPEKREHSCKGSYIFCIITVFKNIDIKKCSMEKNFMQCNSEMLLKEKYTLLFPFEWYILYFKNYFQ